MPKGSPESGGGHFTQFTEGQCLPEQMVGPATAANYEDGQLYSCNRYEFVGPCGRLATADEGVKPEDRLPGNVAVGTAGRGFCPHSRIGFLLED